MTRDDQGFDAFFNEAFMGSFRLAHRLLKDRAEAEDVAAEACARAFADWGRIKDLSYRTAWLLRVTSNLAIDSHRRRRRLPFIPTLQPSADDAVDDRIALGTALRALPRRQRESIALRYLAGLQEKEVAAVMGVSVGSVKTHVHRGLASLRTRLGDSMEEVHLAG